MPIIISEPHAVEQSTYAISVSFFDDAGAAVIPTASSVKWTLTDEKGKVINARSDVAITSAATIVIVLRGADLGEIDSKNTIRIVTVKGTYNSTLGTALEIKDQIQFTLDNLVS